MKIFQGKKRFFVVLVLVLFGGYLAVTFARSFSGGEKVPLAFSDARLQGALIAQAIVGASNDSIKDLEEINKFDQAGDFNSALDLVTKAVGRSQEIRNQAIKLSAELQKMTEAVAEVKSDSARQAALNSISSYLSIINQLISYSGETEHLLEVLRNRFMGKFSPDDKVDAIVAEINSEIQAINDFNTQADQAIKKFDQLVN